MAKFDLKFISNDDENITIKTFSQTDQIIIEIQSHDESITICLDKSTSIKFAKTLRTEINKIESEVGNG